MTKIILPYWKTIDFIIMLVVAVIILLVLGCGKHYDCYNLGKYDKSIIGDVVDYCTSDCMTDTTKDKYGHQKDWKTGK